MENEPHIRLVDPHPERDGGTHDDAPLRHEQALGFGALIGTHARVVGNCPEALRNKETRPFLGRFPREGVDNARLPRPAIEEIQQLLLGIRLGCDGKLDVGPVEARDVKFCRATEQLGHDVAPGRLVGRRRKGTNGNSRKRVAQLLEHVIFRPEGGSPLGDAMGLIDGDQLDIEPRECGDHALRHQAFGRKIEKPHIACRHPSPDGDILFPAGRRIDRLGRDTRQFQCRHLILHQRDERRHDDGEAAPRQRRNLIAKRLAGPRRHHRENIAAGDERIDNRLLPRPKALEAEGLAENVVLVQSGLLRDQSVL